MSEDNRREGQLGQLGGAHGGQRTHDHFMQVFNISWSVPRGEYDPLVRKPVFHGSSEWLRKLMNVLSALDQRRATQGRQRIATDLNAPVSDQVAFVHDYYTLCHQGGVAFERRARSASRRTGA